MNTAKTFCTAALVITNLLISLPTSAITREEPVPIYGSYNAYLDHSKQTFNGRPDVSKSVIQPASFSTVCISSGCVAHWQLSTRLSDNPNAPTLLDYHWINGRWESTGEYPFRCNNGNKVTVTRFDFLTPKGGGNFSGERSFTVHGVGCPGDGPGIYRLPFTLTPT